MAQESALHIKLDKATDAQLKKLAYDRKTSKGQLIREAVSACYLTRSEELSLTQQQALAACQGGFISLGKLADVMGMHILELREWLDERNLNIPVAYGDEDDANA